MSNVVYEIRWDSGFVCYGLRFLYWDFLDVVKMQEFLSRSEKTEVWGLSDCLSASMHKDNKNGEN
jgi:hypothetical protein